jgi:hypothetical protein
VAEIVLGPDDAEGNRPAEIEWILRKFNKNEQLLKTIGICNSTIIINLFIGPSR